MGTFKSTRTIFGTFLCSFLCTLLGVLFLGTFVGTCLCTFYRKIQFLVFFALFWALLKVNYYVGPTLIQFQDLKLKITAVVFFFTAPYFCLRSQNFTVFWLWAAITPVQNLTRPISSTFSESSGCQLFHGPILDIFFFEKISRNLRFMQNVDF